MWRYILVSALWGIGSIRAVNYIKQEWKNNRMAAVAASLLLLGSGSLIGMVVRLTA